MTHHLCTGVTLVACAACATDRSPDEPPPPSAVTGTIRTVHWDEQDNAVPLGEPPNNVFLYAELPDGDVRPATIADDGTFEIPGTTPTGPYWLRYVDGNFEREDIYIYTDAAQIDLGRDEVGAVGPVAASDQTQVVVDAGGLTPWQDGEDGDFLMANLGYWSVLATFYATNVPVAGDTALANLTYAWQAMPLTKTTGVPATFVQVASAHDDGMAMDYAAPIKSFRTDPITISDAATTHITGTFGDPRPIDVPVRWARSQFFAAANDMHVSACSQDLAFQTYWVHALPGGGGHGELARSFIDPLAGIPEFGPRVVDNVLIDGEADLDGVLHVANPYPSEWTYAKYALVFDLACPLPGGGPTPGNASLEIGVVTSDLGTRAAPLVGPVRDVRIEGRDLGVPQAGVGADPTISWSPPAIGAPTAYEVHLFEVAANGMFGGITLSEDAKLIVPGDVTSITLPRELLVQGTIYTLHIRAIARAGQVATTAPFRAGIPVGYADFSTNYFEP